MRRQLPGKKTLVIDKDLEQKLSMITDKVTLEENGIDDTILYLTTDVRRG